MQHKQVKRYDSNQQECKFLYTWLQNSDYGKTLKIIPERQEMYDKCDNKKDRTKATNKSTNNEHTNKLLLRKTNTNLELTVIL